MSAYLLVAIGEEQYALAVEDVLEVVTTSDPEPLFGAAGAVVGLQNLRGDIVPLLDLGSLVGLPQGHVGGKMVVVEHLGRRAALAVDSVLDVATFEAGVAGRVEAAPLRASVVVEGALVGVLDVGALLDGLRSGSAR